MKAERGQVALYFNSNGHATLQHLAADGSSRLRTPLSARHVSTPLLNAGIPSSKEIPALAAPCSAASAKTAAIRRTIIRYLIKTDNPGNGG